MLQARLRQSPVFAPLMMGPRCFAPAVVGTRLFDLTRDVSSCQDVNMQLHASGTAATRAGRLTVLHAAVRWLREGVATLSGRRDMNKIAGGSY